jgi:adenosine deaminase/adenosine deaminase CECR1
LTTRDTLHPLARTLLAAALLVGCAMPLASSAAPTAEQTISAWLERNRESPGRLRAFLRRMPKGAELHTHLSGAVYAEDYLKWAAAEGYCLERPSLMLVKAIECSANLARMPLAEALQDNALYGHILDRWSTRDFTRDGRSGHDNFFQAFAGFSAVSGDPDRQDAMAAVVANRAAAQSIGYLELMITVNADAVRRLGRSIPWTGSLEEMHSALLAKGLPTLVNDGRQQLQKLSRSQANILQCATASAQPGCRVTIRFLQQTRRNQDPQDVFTQLVYAFELAQASEEVVGINLVGPEDDPLALRDYSLHMQMLRWLRARYPSVPIALHAGELTLDLAPPEQLSFHIREAVEIAGARRIGHGVAISFERDAAQLLGLMARLRVLVELCLTSNEVILGIKGVDHPFLDYQKAHVPTVLASDDEGVLRTDLSEQFLLAVRRYRLSYGSLKTMARNSLEYSFLPGQSLWASDSYRTRINACRSRWAPSTGCKAFLASSAKARQQWQLEMDLDRFEQHPLP